MICQQQGVCLWRVAGWWVWRGCEYAGLSGCRGMRGHDGPTNTIKASLIQVSANGGEGSTHIEAFRDDILGET